MHKHAFSPLAGQDTVSQAFRPTQYAAPLASLDPIPMIDTTHTVVELLAPVGTTVHAGLDGVVFLTPRAILNVGLIQNITSWHFNPDAQLVQMLALVELSEHFRALVTRGESATCLAAEVEAVCRLLRAVPDEERAGDVHLIAAPMPDQERAAELMVGALAAQNMLFQPC
jgi:hypothetical protein